MFGANQREKHTERRAIHALEQTTKNVVVIEEVAPRRRLRVKKGHLEFCELLVETLEDCWARAGWVNASTALDDLKPLLDVSNVS